MRYQVNCSQAEAAARFDGFLSGDSARLTKHRRLEGKRRMQPDGGQTFKLEIRDESFWTARSPRVFLKGQMTEHDSQTTVTAQFAYPLQMWVFFLIVGAITAVHPEFFPAVILLAIIPGVPWLMHNSVNRDDLAKAMEDCFGEKEEPKNSEVQETA